MDNVELSKALKDLEALCKSSIKRAARSFKRSKGGYADLSYLLTDDSWLEVYDTAIDSLLTTEADVELWLIVWQASRDVVVKLLRQDLLRIKHRDAIAKDNVVEESTHPTDPIDSERIPSIVAWLASMRLPESTILYAVRLLCGQAPKNSEPSRTRHRQRLREALAGDSAEGFASAVLHAVGVR